MAKKTVYTNHQSFQIYLVVTSVALPVFNIIIELSRATFITTANEMVVLDALGFSEPGRAYGMVRRGDITYGGKMVVNPSGGLPHGANWTCSMC